MFSYPQPQQLGFGSTLLRTSRSLDYRDMELPRPISASCPLVVSRQRSLNQEDVGQTFCLVCHKDLKPARQSIIQTLNGDIYHKSCARQLLNNIQRLNISAHSDPNSDQYGRHQSNASSDNMRELLIPKDRCHTKEASGLLHGVRNIGHRIQECLRPSRSIKEEKICGVYQNLDNGETEFVWRNPNSPRFRLGPDHRSF